jgi:hypothetical protein
MKWQREVSAEGRKQMTDDIQRAFAKAITTWLDKS